MGFQLRAPAPASFRGRLVSVAVLAALVAGTTFAPVAAQPLPDDVRTILVTGTGAATAPAETARVQFMIASYGDMGMGMGEMPMSEEEIAAQNEMLQSTPVAEQSQFPSISDLGGPNVLTEEDLAPVIDAVIEAGAPEDAITVQTGPTVGDYYGPGSPAYGLIEVLVPDPTLELVNAMVDAAYATASGALAMEQVGVEYNLADCGPLLDTARQAAFADARARAEALAQHVGASVEAPVQIADYGSWSFGSLQLPIPGDTSCPPSPDIGFGPIGRSTSFNTPPFNSLAPAQASVLVQLSVTYEFELASQ